MSIDTPPAPGEVGTPAPVNAAALLTQVAADISTIASKQVDPVLLTSQIKNAVGLLFHPATVDQVASVASSIEQVASNHSQTVSGLSQITASQAQTQQAVASLEQRLSTAATQDITTHAAIYRDALFVVVGVVGTCLVALLAFWVLGDNQRALALLEGLRDDLAVILTPILTGLFGWLALDRPGDTKA